MKAIVAISDNWAIGNKGELPWPKIKEDFKFFKNLTTGKELIMGKKTYDSLPFTGLRDRWIGVLSTQWEYTGCLIRGDINSKDWFTQGITLHMIEQARRFCRDSKKGVIVCGGASIYKQFLPDCYELYITHVKGEYEADTFFPFTLKEIKTMFPYLSYVTGFGEHKVIRYSKK